MLLRFSCLLAIAILAGPLATVSAAAWEPSKEWGYEATEECPNRETLCVVVSCPERGSPSFELMLFEHGRGTGEEIVVKVDQNSYPLTLPERGENGLYRWPLTGDLSRSLQGGKTAGIVVDPGSRPSPFSLRGSGKAIRKVLAVCEAGSSTNAAAANSISHADVSLTGLSDNEGCAEAVSNGVVTSVQRVNGKQEVEGFRFNDVKFGESYINVSLPEDMNSARKAAIHTQLVEVINVGATMRIRVQGCGAAGRIEVLSEIISY